MNSPGSHSADLGLNAYWQAVYRVEHPFRPFVLRFLGAENPSSGHAGLGDPWAIVTAFNPQSRTLRGGENLDRHDRLREAIRARGLCAFGSVSSDGRGHWKERGFAVVGIPRSAALELGRLFEQRAVVCGENGRIGLLAMKTEQWLARPARVFNARRLSPGRLPAAAR